jgi:hypothetical protein
MTTEEEYANFRRTMVRHQTNEISMEEMNDLLLDIFKDYPTLIYKYKKIMESEKVTKPSLRLQKIQE